MVIAILLDRGSTDPLDRASLQSCGSQCPDSSRRRLAGSKRTLLRELRDTIFVVTERIAQDALRVLAQQRSSHGIDRRRNTHVDRWLDIGNPFGRRMRNLI